MGLTVKVIIILTGRAIQDPILHSIQEATFIVYYESFHDLLNSNIISSNIIRIISPQNIISLSYKIVKPLSLNFSKSL